MLFAGLFSTAGRTPVGYQGICGQRELDIPFEVVVEIFAADSAIDFVDPFYDQGDFGEALEDHFFTDAEKTIHKHKLKRFDKE
jgi:hypothetical protein